MVGGTAADLAVEKEGEMVAAMGVETAVVRVVVRAVEKVGGREEGWGEVKVAGWGVAKAAGSEEAKEEARGAGWVAAMEAVAVVDCTRTH